MGNIDDGRKVSIQKKLECIEKEYDVEVILAIESGSRAWGFESTDSDYDVRFIYKHKPEWYIHVLPKRDVIELPINAVDDYSGWDIKKALYLLNKSNPVLFEWLRSPIVYKKNARYFNELLSASDIFFNPISCMYHYLSMAKTNYREYLQGDLVKAKKYFYALRPVLSCMWIEGYGEAPPVEFEILLGQIEDSELLDDITSLLVRKKAGVELGAERRIESINHFIESNIGKYECSVSGYRVNERPGSDVLDKLLLKIVG